MASANRISHEIMLVFVCLIKVKCFVLSRIVQVCNSWSVFFSWTVFIPSLLPQISLNRQLWIQKTCSACGQWLSFRPREWDQGPWKASKFIPKVRHHLTCHHGNMTGQWDATAAWLTYICTLFDFLTWENKVLFSNEGADMIDTDTS